MADYTKAEVRPYEYIVQRPVAQSSYAEWYSKRFFLSHNFLASLHQRIAEIQRVGKDIVRIALTLILEQNMLQQVQENPSINARKLAHSGKISCSSI